MPPDTSNETPVYDRVEKREKLWTKAKKDQTAVIVEACMKVDKVGLDVVAIRQEVKKIRHSVHEIKDLIYVLHPEANPEQSFMDKVEEHKISIMTMTIAVLGLGLSVVLALHGGV